MERREIHTIFLAGNPLFEILEHRQRDNIKATLKEKNGRLCWTYLALYRDQ
jgi:hypothetical protein